MKKPPLPEEDLNEALRNAEDALFAKRTREARIYLAPNATLVWDGEFLVVFEGRRKRSLLDCSRDLRLEAFQKLSMLTNIV
jgi:hypothetical protein